MKVYKKTVHLIGETVLVHYQINHKDGIFKAEIKKIFKVSTWMGVNRTTIIYDEKNKNEKNKIIFRTLAFIIEDSGQFKNNCWEIEKKERYKGKRLDSGSSFNIKTKKN